MSRFKFEFPEEEILELEIGENIYQVDADDEYVLKAIKDFTDYVDSLNDVPESIDLAFEIMDRYKELIENIIGEGSVEEIFDGRNITATGLEKLCKFILNSIEEFKNEKRQKSQPEPIAPIRMNRTQRRAVNKRRK